MKRLFSFLLALHFISTSLFGQELSLADLIDIALKNNPETAKVWANVKRAQAVVGIAKGSLYPHLDGQASVTHAREVKFPNGPNTVFTSYSGELSLNYLLFDFGERSATIRATKEALKAAQWGSDFTIQHIMTMVASNYYEYLNADELLKSRESSLEDACTILESATDMQNAGLKSSSDSVTAKAAVAEIQIALAQQKASAAIAYGKLLTTLSLPMGTKLEVETTPEGMQNPLFSEGITTLIATAEEQRADLMAKQATLAEMNARVDRAKKAPLPKLRALGQGGWLEYSKHQGNGYNYSAGLALDIPIFRGFEYSYEKRRAIADAEITASELIELQNSIALEVLSFSETVKAAQESLKYSEEYFEEAYDAYECSLECYKAGILNIFDMLQSQRLLADARNKRAQAKTQWLVSLSQLAFVTGSLSK